MKKITGTKEELNMKKITGTKEEVLAVLEATFPLLPIKPATMKIGDKWPLGAKGEFTWKEQVDKATQKTGQVYFLEAEKSRAAGFGGELSLSVKTIGVDITDAPEDASLPKSLR